MQVPALFGAGLTASSSKVDPSQKIATAAKQFEAILLNEMLKSARETDQNEDEQASALSDFGQQQFAQALADRGGLGIAKMVVAGLEKHAD